MSEQGINPEELRTAETAGASEKKKKQKKEKVRKSVGREILEWVLTIVVAVVAALIIRSFVFELVKVDGGPFPSRAITPPNRRPGLPSVRRSGWMW